MGNYEMAIIKQKEILSEVEMNSELYASNQVTLGEMYFHFGNNLDAINNFNQAANTFKNLGVDNSTMLARAYNGLGLCHFGLGNYTESDEAYFNAIQVLEKNTEDNQLFYSRIFSNIAVLSHVTGDYESAKQLHLNSLIILEDLNQTNSLEYAEGLFTYATLLKDIGELDKALTTINKAEKVYSQFLDPQHLKFANLKTVLAEINLNNGNYKAALKLFEESAQAFKSNAPETNPGYGFAINGLATTYQLLGDLNKALEYYLLAENELKRTLSDTHKDYGINQMNIGIIYSTLGNYEKCYDYFNKAIEIIANSIGTNNTTYGQLCVSLLGVVYKEQPQNLLQFEDLIDTAINIFGNTTKKDGLFYNYALFYKALTEAKRGNINKSIKLLNNAEKNIADNLSGDNPVYSNVIFYLGLNYSLVKDYSNSLKYYEKYNDYVIRNISSVFAFRNHEDKQKYLNSIEYWFSDFTAIAMDDRFELEDIKSITLNNQLLRKGLLLNSSKDVLLELESLNDTSISEKVKQYRTLKTSLDQQKFNLQTESDSQFQNTFNSLEAGLVEIYSDKFSNAMSFKRDWKNIKNSLQKNEIAIEFVRYQSSLKYKYIAYIIKPNIEHPIVVELSSEAKLQDLISKKGPNQLYASRGSKAQTMAIGTELYNLIWKPIEAHTNDVETVYYSPVGLLNQIPFAALPNEEGTLLLEAYNLQQLSSTYLLTQQKHKASLSNNLFIGGVDYDATNSNNSVSKKQDISFLKNKKGTRGMASSWNYLSGTLSEIQAIESLLQQNKLTVNTWSGKTATEEAFKSLSGNSKSVLHIATHGFFFENPTETNTEFNPDLVEQSVYKLSEDPLMRSGLILSGANESWKQGGNTSQGEDGILTALEISNLDLSNTDLVVLSACETGLGDINGSEGVYGLQRAFKMAGVKAIIMSLWEVPDAETAEFMQSFYGNWLTSNSMKQAFRQTQLEMSSKYKSEPEKWAAFVLFE